MNFSKALELIKEGFSMTRIGWNGKGLFISIQRPDANSKMTRPYIYITTPPGNPNEDVQRVPWLASQTDLMAEDWQYAHVGTGTTTTQEAAPQTTQQ